MLVRIALNLSDMQKQENVDSVMRNLQIRKKLRATKIHLAMSVSNKNARIWKMQTVRNSSHVDTHAKVSTENKNAYLVSTLSVSQRSGKKQSKLETFKTTQKFCKRE